MKTFSKTPHIYVFFLVQQKHMVWFGKNIGGEANSGLPGESPQTGGEVDGSFKLLQAPSITLLVVALQIATSWCNL